MADTFVLRTDCLPPTTRVASVQALEGISELYELRIGLLVPSTADLDAAVFARASIECARGSASLPWVFHGVFSVVEQLHEQDGMVLCMAVLVPQMFALSQTKHSRVFVEESVPDIIRKIFEAGGFGGDDFAFKLEQSYEKREFVCQYQESDYAFVCRWMEREGMYFFFEQSGEREKLVITDSRSMHAALDSGSVRYRPLAGADATASDALESFLLRRTALPKRVELRDYNYAKPGLELLVRSPVSPTGTGELSTFGANFATEAEGKRLARLRAEELQATARTFHGRGRVFNLRPCHAFELAEHPNETFNRAYLATRVVHTANQAAKDPRSMRLLGLESVEDYEVSVEAIASDVQYRAPRQAPWPRVDSFESATVCGAAESGLPQIDEHGRYRVRIKFDENDLVDGKASCPVRMLQPHAGEREGFHAPLHKGTEVVLLFLGGDPDRPVIAGALPNAVTRSPVHIDVNYWNIWLTHVGNYINLIDVDARIEIYSPSYETHIHMGDVRHEWGFELKTEFHAHFDIKGEFHVDVELDVEFDFHANVALNVLCAAYVDIQATLELHVHLDAQLTFDLSLDVDVGVDVNLDVKNDVNVEVHNDVNLTVDNTFKTDVLVDCSLHVTNDWNIAVDNSVHQVIAVDYVHEVHNDYSLSVTHNYFVGVDVDLFVDVKNNLTLKAANVFKLAVAVAFIEVTGTQIKLDTGAGAKLVMLGGDIYIECNSLTVNAKTAIKGTATTLELEGTGGASMTSLGNVEIKGAAVKLNP